MAYELFKRTGFRVEEPSLSIVPDGRIALNSAAVRAFNAAGVKSVLLLWDKENRKLALKGTARGDEDAYAVSIVPNAHSGSLRAKSFLNYIGWNAPKRMLFRGAWSSKDKMLEITLPGEHLRAAPGPTLRKAKSAS